MMEDLRQMNPIEQMIHTKSEYSKSSEENLDNS